MEFSVVLPILLLIIIGTAELGMYFRTYQAVSYASREGARIGGFVGDISNADCLIVVGVAEILGADMTRVERLEIFKADENGDPELINTATVIGDPSDCDEPDAADDGWTFSINWPATSRNTVFGPTSDLDIIGVRIVLDYGWVTGFPPFSGTVTIDESTITRLEPEAFE